MDYSSIEEAVEFMKSHGLYELTWEKSGAHLSLKMGTPGAVSFAPQSFSQAQQAKVETPKAEPEKKNALQILSPFVGTFYRSPAPGSDPYASEGQTVRPGDVLCIVEAMKLMNEIESEVTGRITRVLVEDGHPVEYGEPLFQYEKL